MSYKLFDQGLSADEINEIKRTKGVENHMLKRLQQWRESEHVLNILRTIRANEGILDEMMMKKWLEVTKGKN